MSTLHTNTVETSSGGPVTLTKQSAAKAWVNFNGYTTPVAIRSSFNSSSLVDDGVGKYDVNFTNNMSTDYSVTGSCGQATTTDRTTAWFSVGSAHANNSHTPALVTGSYTILLTYQTQSNLDYDTVSGTVNGDLA